MLRSLMRPGLFGLGGAGIGWLYYTYFGCTTGCPITSDPVRTMIWFGVVGVLVSLLFEKG